MNTTGVAVRYARGLLEEQDVAVADPYGRLHEIQPAVAGLQVLSRDVDLSITDGDTVAVRLSTTALALATQRTVSWAETHVVQVERGRVTTVWPEFPSRRITALAAGHELRWPAPPALRSTRAAAAVVRTLAKVGRSRAPAAEPAQVVGRYVEEFKNAQRFSVFPRLFDPGFRHHFDFPGRADGFESFMSVGRDLLSAFSDLHVDVEALLAQGELVVERNHVRAVHHRAFAGVAASGRPVSWTETHLYRVREGRIVENWPGVDTERLVHSLGPR